MKIIDLHSDLIGKVCRLHPAAVQLAKVYEDLFSFGNAQCTERLLFFQNYHDCKLAFIFLDEAPVTRYTETWFCVKEFSTTGKKVNGDWYWFTLNQLIICV